MTATDAGRPAAGGRTGRPSSRPRGRGPRPARPGVRSSSRRKCRVIAALTGMPSWPASLGALGQPRPAAAARRGTRRPASAVRISGGARRSTSGCTALARNPAVAQRGGGPAATGVGQHDAEQQTGPADLGDQRVAERLDAVAEPLADPLDVVEQARRPRSCRGPPAPRRSRPGCRRRCCRASPGRAASPAAPKREAGADRQPAAESLGQRDHVRLDALGLVREPVAGAADPGLHLVEHEQRAVLRWQISRAAAR